MRPVISGDLWRQNFAYHREGGVRRAKSRCKYRPVQSWRDTFGAFFPPERPCRPDSDVVTAALPVSAFSRHVLWYLCIVVMGAVHGWLTRHLWRRFVRDYVMLCPLWLAVLFRFRHAHYRRQLCALAAQTRRRRPSSDVRGDPRRPHRRWAVPAVGCPSRCPPPSESHPGHRRRERRGSPGLPPPRLAPAGPGAGGGAVGGRGGARMAPPRAAAHPPEAGRRHRPAVSLPAVGRQRPARPRLPGRASPDGALLAAVELPGRRRRPPVAGRLARPGGRHQVGVGDPLRSASLSPAVTRMTVGR